MRAFTFLEIGEHTEPTDLVADCLRKKRGQFYVVPAELFELVEQRTLDRHGHAGLRHRGGF